MLTVAPLVGAWIEIPRRPLWLFPGGVAPLVGAWIEILRVLDNILAKSRRSPRGSVD